MIGSRDAAFSLTSDGWTSSKNKKIQWSATTVHFISDWKMRRITDVCRRIKVKGNLEVRFPRK